MIRHAVHRVSEPSRSASSLACALGLSLGIATPSDAQQTPEPSASKTVVVIGEAVEEPLGADKITTAIVNTPQAISTVDRAELQRRAVNNLTDAVRSVPGISLGAGETSWQGNNLVLRGFTTRNDTFLDGMRDYGYYFRDPFNAEAVQVLKGPGSTLFGRGSTGGVINQVSKVPSRSPVSELEVASGTDATMRLTADAGGRLGDAVVVRVTGMAHRSSVADRDGGRNRRWGVAPTIAVGIGRGLRAQLGYFHQQEDNRPDYGIPWFNGAPARVDRDNYYGFVDDYLNTNVHIVTGKLEYDVLPGVTLREQMRYSHDTRRFRTTEAAIPSGTAAATPLAAITVNRNVFSGYSTDEFAQSQSDVRATFALGSVKHTVVAGVELGREAPRPVYVFHEGVITTNLANPHPQPFTERNSYVRLRTRTRGTSLGLFALDTIEVGDNWLGIVGVRWDRFAAHYASTGYVNSGAVVATTAIDRIDKNASYRAAVVYKPTRRSSLYASYATSFNPSAEGIESLVSAGRSGAQANVNADPETGRIMEVGGKWDAVRRRLLLTASAFSIGKTNVRIPDPIVTNQNINGGRQRVRGVEIEASGAITPRWSVKASYSHLASETISVTNAASGGSPRVGAPLTIVPRDSASLQTDYAITRRLEVGVGMTYQSSRLGQNTVASYLVAPGYTVFETRARYRLTNDVLIQANVYNLADTLYFDQLHPFHVVPGAGRSALFSLSWKR